MKRTLLLMSITLSVLLISTHAENMLMQVYQPTSLLGTELDADPLESGANITATIVSRPILVGGAFLECPVAAISLPHKIAGSGDNFPNESNLIVLVKGRVYAEYGQTEHKIVADFSQSTIPENLGVTLVQVMQITAICLKKTLGNQHTTPIFISWVAPKGSSIDISKLPAIIK